MKITTGIKNTVRAGVTGAKKAKSVLSTKTSFMIAGVVAGIIALAHSIGIRIVAE